MWSSSDIDDQNAGTLPFSFIWVFQRIAATAPIPSAPQITGTLSPIRAASAFAGFWSCSAPGPSRSASVESSATVSSTSPARPGSRPIASRAPSAAKPRCPRAARGWDPAGTGTTGDPASAASAARVPPDVTQRTRHPRARASRNAESVSEVFPEYEETTTSVWGPAYAGSSWPRFTSTGTPSRSRNTVRSTSPATAEPPMPQKVTAVAPSADGSSRATAASYAARQSSGQAGDRPQHVRGVEGTQRLDVVQVDHRPPPGFSASSISITGMSSRTG